MDVISGFIQAIPSAAASPLALIAYLATLVAWVIIAYRVNRFRELMTRIERLPPGDRLAAIAIEIGRAVPPGLTGEQYLRMRIHTFLFIGFLALCGALSTVALKAGYDFYQQMIRADNLTREILAPPSSDYMSAVETLVNGSQMVKEAAAEIRPPLSAANLREIIDGLAQQRLNREQINERLAELAGTDRLKRANAVLAGAATRLDTSYAKLASCFRQADCRTGFEADMLCKALLSIKRSIDAANDIGRGIQGVNYNLSGTSPMLGGGSMDVDFLMIGANSIDYLISASCR